MEEDPNLIKMYAAGLGDCIGTSGAVVVLMDSGRKVQLTVPDVNMPSVSSFFVDYPDLELVSDPPLSLELCTKKLDDFVGNLNAQAIAHPEASKLDFVRRSYLMMGIEYKHRWISCPIPKASVQVEQFPVEVDDYIFLHDDPVRSFNIDRNKLPKGNAFYPGRDTSKSILSFRDAILNAREVHVMDGPFFHFADQFVLEGKLFLHRYPKQYMPGFNDYQTLNKWTDVW